MRSLAAVHQFHSGTAVGDAVTNQMLSLQRRLRALGFLSEIYAQHIVPELAEIIRPMSQLQSRPATLLLVHHSMGHTAFDELMAVDLPMVTVFHSITPARFFEDRVTRHFVRVGFEQLRTLAERSVFGIAVSNHNRRQMYEAGFRLVEVLPVRTDFAEHRGVRPHRGGPSGQWLFVGRIVPNKRQRDLVAAFARFHAAWGEGHLHLVGDTSMADYVEHVRADIGRLGLSSAITLHGKVGQEELLVRYRDADVFVCASEHEGFGVPLLEAMAAGVPVIACDEAAVAETMGGAGVLLHTHDPDTIAAAARLLIVDRNLHQQVVAHQDARLARIESFDVDSFLGGVVARFVNGDSRTTVQVQGPFETSYSLAILNRELALGLAGFAELDVSIHATEGPGDYLPSAEDLAAHPDAAELYRRSARVPYPEVAIRQMFPPRVADTTAGTTFQYFGWEESLLPSTVVDDFNRYLDGIGTMSTYVSEVLRDSGVTVPMAVVGVGVHAPDHAARIDAPELTGLRSRRILHISSAFPRKGVDVLLRAYFQAFDDRDDVTLVLKTFPNPHNEVAAQLAALREEFADAPHVCWIDRDLDRAEIDALYGLATAYVHSARGEGFGLPVAEAMLAGVPVISVAATGLADFVSDATARVVGHTFVPAASHVSVPGSMWAEPDVDDLCRALREVVDDPDDDRRRARADAARQLIERDHSASSVAARWHDFITRRRADQRGLRVAAITTFNSRCGIAEYSAHLYEPMDDWVHLEVHADIKVEVHDPDLETFVRRTWFNHRSGQVEVLLEALERSSAQLVHLQHNMGFFTLPELARIIRQEQPRRPIVITLHRTIPLEVDGGVEAMSDIADELRSVDAIVVHQESDRRRLAEAGVSDNVHVMLHGTEELVEIDRDAARKRHRVDAHAFVLGTYGFLLPHKGMMRLLAATALLRDRGVDAQVVATCALHPDPSSAAHLAEVRAEIDRLGLTPFVRLVTDFLDPDASRDLLACADVLVLPYEQTNESASGALRSVLPLGRAMVTSRLPIFEDVLESVASLPAPVQPAELADVLEELWLDPNARQRLAAAVRTFAAETSWATVAGRTRELYQRLLSERANDARDATVE